MDDEKKTEVTVEEGNESSDDIDTTEEAVEGDNTKTTVTEIDRSSTVKPDKVG